MKLPVIVLICCSLVGSNAFVTKASLLAQSNEHSRLAFERSMVPSSGDPAKAFTEYMAKSHEEKLKALKDLEDKKNSEIKALKEEIENVKGGSIVQAQTPTTVPAPVVKGSIEELSAKLLAYQKFMSEYIVKSQQEKYNAVKAAEAAVAKKYEEKLSAFMLPGSQTAGTGDGEGSKLFQDRNAKIAAAASAGKSRWGDKEIQKVTGIKMTKSIPSQSPKSVSPPSLDNIAAADHGLRADGGVGGLTLEERVLSGATAAVGLSPANGAAVVTTQSSLFVMRNAKIAQAAKAGKQSRWGIQEEKRAVKVAATTSLLSAQAMAIEPSPEILAADHGLRADGGVGGPTLAERVNLGAMLLQ